MAFVNINRRKYYTKITTSNKYELKIIEIDAN